MKTFAKVILVLFLTVLPLSVWAHGNQKHFLGTVVSISASEITVKTTAGTEQKIAITPTTKLLRGEVTVHVADFRPGERVVVHAKPRGEVWEATEIKVGGSGPLKGLSSL